MHTLSVCITYIAFKLYGGGEMYKNVSTLDLSYSHRSTYLTLGNRPVQLAIV
jgi:hypothetical protein